jgi:sec-independent protein translocase protein TatA
MELVLILIIVAMLFGVGKLPEVFGAVGKGIKEFRKEADGETSPSKSAAATPAATSAITDASSTPAAPMAQGTPAAPSAPVTPVVAVPTPSNDKVDTAVQTPQ